MVDDPPMEGLAGRRSDGSAVESGSYRNVEDHDTDLHVNVCRTSALSGDFPGRQLVTGLRVETEG